MPVTDPNATPPAMSYPGATGNSDMVTYTIGRAADNDIIIDEPSISRRHAELIAEPGGKYRLKDLGSSNGTHIQHGGGWETIGEAAFEIETGTTIRLGQKITTLADLLDLREEILGEDERPLGEGSYGNEGRFAATTDTTRGSNDAGTPDHGPPTTNARALPNWAVPAGAIGGGAALILVVFLVLLMGPFGGSGRTDFVEACTIRSGSRVKCQCWGTALRRIFSKQEFDRLTTAIVKRDFLTALPPTLRAKYTRIRGVIRAQCGPLAP